MSSDLPGLPVDESNLVVRAAEAFAASIADLDAGDLPRFIGEASGGAVQVSSSSDSGSFSKVAANAATNETGNGESVDARSNEAGQPMATRESMGKSTRVVPVHAVLKKVIPLGAGLGGGSSDAARTLVALNRAWAARRTPAQLADVAERLGSDVPFFLYGPSSVCTGRGEVVRPVTQPRRARWVVLVLPEIHMPTAAVYRRFDELKLGFDEDIDREPDWTSWAELSAKELLVRLVNDLEAPAFEIRPDLQNLRADIELQLGRVVRMSGSGSSLFTLFDDREDAKSAARLISGRFDTKALAVEMASRLRDDEDDEGHVNAGALPA